MTRMVDVAGEALALDARPDPAVPDAFVVTLGARQVRVVAQRAPDGSLLLTREDGRRVRAVVSAVGSDRWVTVGATTVVVREARPEGAASEDAGGLEAPMPGKVLEVAVAPGDRVEAGAVLLVVEAMKMEHALRAPRAGIVAAVAAREGDMVNPGTPLVTLEEEPAAAPAAAAVDPDVEGLA